MRVLTVDNQMFQIDVRKCIIWLRFFKEADHPQYHDVRIPTEEEMSALQDNMDNQVDEILKRKCVANDSQTKMLLSYIGSDTTDSRPQTNDPEDEASRIHDATPGIQHVLLLQAQCTGSINDRLLQAIKDAIHGKHSKKKTQSIKINNILPNEFDSNPTILSECFPHVFPTGLTKEFIRGG